MIYHLKFEDLVNMIILFLHYQLLVNQFLILLILVKLIMIFLFFQTKNIIFIFTSIIGLFDISRDVKFLNDERFFGREVKLVFDKFN